MDYSQKIDIVLEQLGIRVNPAETEDQEKKPEEGSSGDSENVEIKAEEPSECEEATKSVKESTIAPSKDSSTVPRKEIEEATDDESDDEGTSMLAPSSK